MTIRPFEHSDYPNKRICVSPMNTALWGGQLDKIWTFVKAGEKIPGLSGGDSNLRIIVQNCPDPNLIKLVLDSMTIEEINYRPRMHFTALVQAAQTYNAPVVELLLKAKADVNLTDLNGNTPLNEAAVYWYTDSKKQCKEDIFRKAVETAQVLIRAGATVDCANNHGKTALHTCVKEDRNFVNTDLITLLVSEGAEPVSVTRSPEILSKINQAVQNGLYIKHSRQEVRNILKFQLLPPIVSLVAQYI